MLWQRAKTTTELARLAYVLLGPRLTTVYIALVLVYSNGGLLALGGTDHVLIETPRTIPPETTCNARWQLYPNLRYTKKQLPDSSYTNEGIVYTNTISRVRTKVIYDYCEGCDAFWYEI
jgi:hypothetical protein